jgi:hypothetical protein
VALAKEEGMVALRIVLTFCGLCVAHYLASFLAMLFCYCTYGQGPAWLVFWAFFFPAFVSKANGLGLVPFGDEALTDTPWAMESNTLVWVTVVYGLWLLARATRMWWDSTPSSASNLEGRAPTR